MSPESVILVVDDDPVLREILCSLLESRYRIVTASSGREAFDLMGKEAVDLVLSDISMPDGTGLDLLTWIRESDPGAPPVVLVTGFSQLSAAEAVRMGAHAVLDKPFTKESLFSVVRGALSAGRKTA